MAGFWGLPAPEQLPGVQQPRSVGAFRHTITNHHYRFTVCAGSAARAPRPLPMGKALADEVTDAAQGLRDVELMDDEEPAEADLPQTPAN